ncbi:hypothetical protein L3049_15420 [Labilibaculum sp. DW002]|uniref:Uncharacterized protein n=1 Tax=Paralabilibaculum antarcticum TaxID=2912572 RepID=A0ABT5VVV5_9BACT|nr:hypothetical protein [Labilibaculum sp. DW002]MDE5419385.1 hypothetical protein [Labilibaculum sp. DW002]
MAHIELEIEGQTQKYEYEESIQGEVVYDINTNEVGIIREDQRSTFKQEVDWMDAFAPYMASFQKKEEDEAKEVDRVYLALATLIIYDEFINASDDATSADIIDHLDAKINEKKDELKADGPINTSAVNISDKVHSEILWAEGKRMVRVRSEKIKNHNRWFGKKQVQQQIKAGNKSENKKNASTAKSAEIKILEKKFWSKDGAINEKFEAINKDLHKDFFEDNNKINSSVDAKLLRYTTEAAADAKLDWTDKKELKATAKASGSFSVAEATGDFSVSLPNQYGFGLMQYCKSIAPNSIDDDYTEIFLKIILGIEGSAFVGICASVSAEMGLSVTEGKENASAQAGLDIFAGAKAQAKAAFEINMMFVEDYVMDAMRDRLKTVGERGEKVVSGKEIEAEKLSKWEKLGSAEIGGFLAAGAGISGVFAVGYFEGKLRYQAKIALVVKVGAGTFMKGFVDAKLVGKFILTVAHGLNWKNISDALDKQTQLLYHTIMNNCFYLQRTVAEVYGELEEKFKEIMDTIHDLRDLPEKGLEQFKIVDDNWDENVPGYSSFKQYNLAFLVLKSTYYSLKQRNENLSEKEAAIALVEKAQQNKISWNYATWQMKIDLIYDMRHDGSGILGGLSEEDKEDAVIAVLESSRNKEEFKKILKGLVDPKNEDREPLLIDDLVDFSQQDRLNYLRNVKFR